jgi:hypothetical protein
MPTVGDKAQTRATQAEIDRLARRLRNRGVKVTVQKPKESK